jgi:alkylation response protein AidB-like acyl-CoA dehydrogenase
MDFALPAAISKDISRLKEFIKDKLAVDLPNWYRDGAVPRTFHRAMGEAGWLGFELTGDYLLKSSALRSACVAEELAKVSPGVAVATLAHVDLGLAGLWLYGSDILKQKYAPSAVKGEILICLGNTEGGAGSDVANIATRAEKVSGGWELNGTKAYVTSGFLSDLAVVSAVSDPGAQRNRRLSLFLVDLEAEGVQRTKLNKQVWIPSDLTRIQMNRVFVPEDHLLGVRGQGLQQVLSIFTHSRIPISALTVGTASGAFELAVEHAKKREVMGRKIVDLQSKAFEIADLYARIEAARLMLWKACWSMETKDDFRLESSLAKYLAVTVAKDVAAWAADLFGAASVIFDHPIHKYPMDAWASSLGEGTQDIQKLVIFREVIKRYNQ